MCNRYQYEFDFDEVQETARTIRQPFRVAPSLGNNPPRDVYPDQDAPVLAQDDDGLILDSMRWGFPPIPGKRPPLTNIRNLHSKWWKDVNREWLLDPAYRVLVPFKRFAEPPHKPTPDRGPGQALVRRSRCGCHGFRGYLAPVAR